MKVMTGLSVLLVLMVAVLVTVAPVAALETVATFAADCTTPKTVFQLGDTVCAKVDSVAGGDIGNIWLQWVAPSGVVAFGSTVTTLVTTSPQNFTQALPTSGPGAEQGLWKAQTANVSNSVARVAANFRVPRQTVIGVHRDATSTSFMRNTNTTGFGDGSVIFGQVAGDVGLWGNWFGTGRYTPGFYRSSDGTFHFATSNVSPTDDLNFQFGPTGGQPLAGDWTGDGTTKIGVFLDGAVYLRNTLTTGPADTAFTYGQTGDQVFAGDFDGDGIATIGVYRDNGFGVGVVYLRNSNTTGMADSFFFYGLLGDMPVTGNWTAAANGMSTIGVYRQSEGTYYLRNSNDTGIADAAIPFGTVTDTPAPTVHNEAPVLGASGTLSYTEGQAATAIDPAVTVTDMDNATLVGATATITGNCSSGQDVLSFAAQNGITGNYTAGTCLMTLSGQSAVTNYQTALRSVKYNNSSVTPSTLGRTVTWQVNDGALVNNLSNQPTSGITISCPTINVSGTIPDLILNQAMSTAAFSQVGGNGTITWSISGQPTGININTSSGDVTGTPTAAGTFSVTVTATDAGGCIGSKNMTVHVNEAPAITSVNSYSAQIGSALNFLVTTTGTPAPAITQAAGGGQTGLPGGATFIDNGNGTATLGGSVTSGGVANYTTTITANNGVAPNATQSFTLQITCPAINITRTGGGSFAAATYNFGYPAGNTFTATGNLNTVHWAFAPNGQPPGINLTIAAGSLSGIPTGTGNFTMIVVATDQVNGCTGQASFPFTINPRIFADSYSNLVNNTEAVVTGGTTSSPSTPSVPLTGTLVSNDTPAGNVSIAAASIGTSATTQGGSVTIAADGTFKYTPPVTVTGLTSDTFNYTATSNFAGPCGSCAPSSGASSASGTATLNLAGRVWYVNPNAGSNGNGQSQSPWNSTANIKQQPTVGGANTSDTIFVYSGPTGNLTANIPLLASQTLWGEGVALVVNTVTLRSAGTAPSLTASAANVVSVNSGNTITGVTLTNSTNALVSGAPAGLTLNTVTMTPSGSANGFDITGGSGTVALTDVTMTGTSSGDVVKVNTGTQSWTFTNSPITQTSGRALNVANKTGGGMTFDATSTVTVSAGTTDGAVTLASNSGTPTFAFSKLALTTSGPARALFLGTTGTVNNSDTTSTISATDTNAGPGTIAIDVASTTLGLTFQNVSVTGTNANVLAGIQLVTVGGTLTVNGGSISTNGGKAVSINGGAASFTYAGTISNSGPSSGISVINKTGGTVTFSGATKTLTTGPNTAVAFTGNNASTTINFTGGGLAISTSSGAGFSATGGGTVNVTGTGNTIGSGTGTALNVTSTTIGASGLTFGSISANGGTNGIVLNGTGSSGALTVTGNAGTCTSLASTCTGGTIQGTSGHGISLTTTQSPSFSFMKITNIALSGIFGGDVTNFTLSNSVIDGVNTAHTANDSNVAFNTNAGGATENNLDGTVSITNSTINNSYQEGISIKSFAGTISSLTITGNSLTSATTTANSISSAIAVEALRNSGGANFATITTGSISNNSITNFPGGAGILVFAGISSGTGSAGGNVGSLASPLLINSNTITGAGPGAAGLGTNGIQVTIGNLSDGFFTIGASGAGNNITNVKGNGVACSKFGNDSGSGTNASKCIIAFNTIDAHNTANSPGINTGADNGVVNTETPQLYLDIHNNTVSNTTGNGILSTIRDVDGNGVFSIVNNTVNQPIQGTTAYGIRVDSGNGGESAGATVCLKISGNTTTGGKNGSGTITAPGIGLRQNNQAGPAGTFNIDGLTPNPSNDAQMEAYVGNIGQNPGSANGTFGANGVSSIDSGATFHAATCTIP